MSQEGHIGEVDVPQVFVIDSASHLEAYNAFWAKPPRQDGILQVSLGGVHYDVCLCAGIMACGVVFPGGDTLPQKREREAACGNPAVHLGVQSDRAVRPA